MKTKSTYYFIVMVIISGFFINWKFSPNPGDNLVNVYVKQNYACTPYQTGAYVEVRNSSTGQLYFSGTTGSEGFVSGNVPNGTYVNITSSYGGHHGMLCSFYVSSLEINAYVCLDDTSC